MSGQVSLGSHLVDVLHNIQKKNKSTCDREDSDMDEVHS